MNSRRPARRPPPSLDSARLNELALRYVGKYATTRAKLREYLTRKLRERGWDEEGPADLEALANRFAELGYVDDAGFALSRSRSLAARGYGRRRLDEKLRLAGVGDGDSAAAHDHADRQAVATALRFAERRRLGPYGDRDADRVQREKWIAAMIRAGHGFGLARAIANLPAGGEVDEDQLTEFVRVADA